MRAWWSPGPLRPSLTTASPTVPAGGAISDTATLSGGVSPTGTITFTLFGPGNPTCTGAAIFTSTKPVAGNGVYPSDPFTTTTPGTYLWVAVYSGDANNSSATSGCGAANESVTVTKANPAIVTHASAPVAAGNPITDTATLSGGAAPTGTITFTVFGPNNAGVHRGGGIHVHRRGGGQRQLHLGAIHPDHGGYLPFRRRLQRRRQ